MKDPNPTFAHLVTRISELYPNFSYLHVVESRDPILDSSDFLRNIWSPRQYISNLGYTRESAIAAADKNGDLISFGQLFISNVSS